MSVTAEAARAFRTWNRGRKASWLGEIAAQRGVRTVLLVGAGGGDEPWENMVERSVADERFAVWCGIDDRSHLSTYVQCDGRALPFPDRSFDLVFSNAVVEHVGDERAQRRFLDEHRRVGRYWAATTPNRWFPIESHTTTVLRHWSGPWRAQRLEFTRLLSRSELRALCPPSAAIVGSALAPTFTVHGSGASMEQELTSHSGDVLVGAAATRRVRS